MFVFFFSERMEILYANDAFVKEMRRAARAFNVKRFYKYNDGPFARQ